MGRAGTSRARGAFKQAFVALVLERGFAATTATEVMRRAGYSRGSFYTHFEDKYDLAQQVVEDEAAWFVRHVLSWDEEAAAASSDERGYSYLVSLREFEHVYQERDTYRLILGSLVPGAGFEEFCRLIQMPEEDEGPVLVGGVEVNRDLFAWSVSRLSMNYVRYWAERDFAGGPEPMARQVAALSSTSLVQTVRGLFEA